MSYAFTDRVVETALLSETKNYFCSVVSRNHKEKLTQLNALSQRFFSFSFRRRRMQQRLLSTGVFMVRRQSWITYCLKYLGKTECVRHKAVPKVVA